MAKNSNEKQLHTPNTFLHFCNLNHGADFYRQIDKQGQISLGNFGYESAKLLLPAHHRSKRLKAHSALWYILRVLLLYDPTLNTENSVTSPLVVVEILEITDVSMETAGTVRFKVIFNLSTELHTFKICN